VNTVGEEEETFFKERASDNDDSGGTITSGGVLRFGKFNEHFSGRLKDLHLVKNGCAIVGDDDFVVRIGNHFVHTFGTETGADGVGDGTCSDDVGLTDVILALVVGV
jgi:hypothetical protein